MTYGFDPSQGLIIVPVRLFGPVGDMIVRLARERIHQSGVSENDCPAT